MLRAKGTFDYFTLKFQSETDEISIGGTIWAPRESFVGLTYHNPPDAEKHCLNSKIASSKLEISYKRSRKSSTPEILMAKDRAAFEILADDRRHGVEIRV